MKTIFSILLIFTILGCNSNGSSLSTVPKKEEAFKLFENSSFELLSSDKTYDQYKIDIGDKLVFLYEKDDVTYVDEYSYDANYTEILLFEIDTSVNSFEYSGKDLSEVNCQYSWRAVTPKMMKVSKSIENGTIKGKKINRDTWEISLDINTDHKFGGFLSRQDSRNITFQQKLKVKTEQKKRK